MVVNKKPGEVEDPVSDPDTADDVLTYITPNAVDGSSSMQSDTTSRTS